MKRNAANNMNSSEAKGKYDSTVTASGGFTPTLR